MQDFKGIAAKLERAKENISNLELEIAAFFDEGDYPILPEDDRKILLKAIEYHKNRIIPPRLNVLSGEIVHHLRSCFDHIVWHFSIGATDEDTGVDFPVFKKEPINAEDRRRYKRKVERINDAAVLKIIEGLQPYKASDPLNDPLFIIHKLDIIEKHRQVLQCAQTGARRFTPEMQSAVEAYQRTYPDFDPAQVAYHFKDQGPLIPYISFRDFGRWKIKPVIPALTELFNYTFKVVQSFEVL